MQLISIILSVFMLYVGTASADCMSELHTHFDFGTIKVEIYDSLNRGTELGYGHDDFAAAAEALRRVWQRSLPHAPRNFRVHFAPESALGIYYGRYREGEIYLNIERMLLTPGIINLRHKIVFVSAHEGVHATQEAWGEKLPDSAVNPNYGTDIYEDEANTNAMAVLKAMYPELVLSINFSGRWFHTPDISSY